MTLSKLNKAVLKRVGKRILILLFFVLVGILATNQYILYRKIGLTRVLDDPDSRAIRVSVLYSEDEKLSKQLSERETHLRELEDARLNSSETQRILEKERNKYNVILGLSSVHGPGVEIKISHSLEASQLVDLVNALRNIGAEAISINGQRINPNTPVSALARQNNYEVFVIGNKAVLQESLTRPGGILELIANGKVEVMDEIILPKA